MPPNDFNRKIIDEFRQNAGQVGGPFQGAPLLLLHSTGRKSGEERINPVAYLQAGDGWAIFASKAGAPTNPDWYHNLKAQPEVSIEVGPETIPAHAREASGEERKRLWEAQKVAMPGFAEYEEKAGDRVIPVVVLERR